MTYMSRLRMYHNRKRSMERISSKDRWGSTSFISPRIIRKSCREYEILAAAMMSVNITPLCSGMVYTGTVALDTSCGVYKCQAGTLTPNVGVGGGSLGLLHREGTGGGDQEDGDYSREHLGIYCR